MFCQIPFVPNPQFGIYPCSWPHYWTYLHFAIDAGIQPSVIGLPGDWGEVNDLSKARAHFGRLCREARCGTILIGWTCVRSPK